MGGTPSIKDYQEMKKDIPFHSWSAAQLVGYTELLEKALKISQFVNKEHAAENKKLKEQLDKALKENKYFLD